MCTVHATKRVAFQQPKRLHKEHSLVETIGVIEESNKKHKKTQVSE